MSDRQLQGAKVLIVEDEFLIADDLARMLSAAGAIPIGPVGTVEQAKTKWAHSGADAAVLDLNLRGDMAFSLAEELSARLPCVIVSGYGPATLPESLAEIPALEKPVDHQKVISLLAQQLGRELSN